jgi:hypothetical protein
MKARRGAASVFGSVPPKFEAMGRRIEATSRVLAPADVDEPLRSMTLAALLRTALAHPFSHVAREGSDVLVFTCHKDGRAERGACIGAKALAPELMEEGGRPLRSVRFALAGLSSAVVTVEQDVWFKSAMAGPETLQQLLWHELEAASIARMLRALSDPTLEPATSKEMLDQLKQSGLEVASFADSTAVQKNELSDAQTAAAMCDEGGVMKWRVFASPLLIQAQEVMLQRAFPDAKWAKLSVSLHRMLWGYANDASGARRVPAIGLDRMGDQFASILEGEAAGTIFDMKTNEAKLESLKGMAAEKD